MFGRAIDAPPGSGGSGARIVTGGHQGPPPPVAYSQSVPHRMPAAEVDLSERLVRMLLAEQHPDLAHLPVELLANGWDNAMFRLGDSLAVRMPRRQLGARILVNEQRWLPVLASRLPLPVPAPVRIGLPGDGYPWAWSVVPFLPGEPASGTPAFDPREAAVAVGGFLGALHVPAPPEAPA